MSPDQSYNPLDHYSTFRARDKSDFPEPLEKFCERINLPKDVTPDYVPKIALEWADFFQRRCGMGRDMTLKAMTMFGDWCTQGVTIEDAEIACQMIGARRDLSTLSPNYFKPVIEDVLKEKQWAKENPVSRGDQPGT
ncbi:hypothetical protein Nhal_1140 [Nitrosococcus halophilus Nc 4]|uniref:Uncharacterized protein n=1 Tax=Nitrosococcus halophilus (strain Nc4) TaxID=472759 RepID=D5BZL3_NITHN|nr:hypothetical protein [Nitrosococcus halophilus]ADE14308.1 hypothetical protein Nhal_1140 [Nitrosococcus halophilus Nc 4]